MIEHVFSPEMMKEREKQLILALADCAGAYCDINFTKNRIIGKAIKIEDGVEYSVHEKIGMPEHCPYTDIANYWGSRLKPEEQPAFFEFFDIERIKECYAKGERLLTYKYWTRDVFENPMLALQKVYLYEDCVTGDLLGLTYITDVKDLEGAKERDAALMEQFKKASDMISMMENLSENVPGGYHRCTTEDGFKIEFASKSFLDVVGWTKEELETEFNNEYLQLVVPEDREFFLSHEQELNETGRVDLVYRLLRKDGAKRWIQDATVRTEQDGEACYQCTLSDITEYVETLNAEKERAEASNLAKSTFLFNASHDIRTPMNAIQGFARMIADNVNNPEIVAEAVQKIIQSGNTLNTLVNDVLEVSRIERGKDVAEEQPLNMREHINKLYEMFAFDMEQVGVNFYEETEIEHENVLGDDLKLTRIAMNLLSNAKKFTPAGGSVTFGVRESGFDGEKAFYTLFVRDTGIGMSKEFQERAFEQFERERSATESGIVGSGLGLSIIKKICDLMNGEYHIESELGKGTEITVKVPLKLSKEAVAMNNTTVDYEKFVGKRILLVEDNEFNREIARYTLEGANFSVEEAENGAVSVDKIMKAGPGYYDVVLMDIQMPIMDGYTATKEIRNITDEKLSLIPIIAMTANAFDEDKQKCLSVGMNGHLGKPLDVDLLMKELAKVLTD